MKVETDTLKLSSEEQLLIGCGPSGEYKQVTEAVSLVSANTISWNRAMRLAHWHRMTGALYAFLRENISEDLVPQTELDHLHGHYRHTAVRSMYIRSEFVRTVRALQVENIELIALKGVALLGSAYKDLGTREMSDIDILVRPGSAERAQEIVRGLGYEPVGTVAPEHKHLPRLHNHDRELSFEVHTHIVSSDSLLHFDIETFWKHAVPVNLHGVDVLVPAPEHMILHLSLHFFLDRRFTSSSGLRQLHDVARVIDESAVKIDWDLFAGDVKKYGLNGPIYSVLSVVAKLMHADIPADVMNDLRPAGYSEKLEELFIRQRVLQTNTLTATELVPHGSVYTTWAVLKGVVRRIAPSQEYMETHYGYDSVEATGHTRLRRLGELVQRTFGYARNPLRLWQEVRVDRWLHSLSSTETVCGNDKPGSA